MYFVQRQIRYASRNAGTFFLDSISDLSVILLPRLLQALSERLFYYIAVSLLPHDTLCELEAAVEAGRALSPILQWHKHPNDYFSREAQNLYFNSLRTYWQELIDLTRYGCTYLVSRRLTVLLPVSDFSFRLYFFRSALVRSQTHVRPCWMRSRGWIMTSRWRLRWGHSADFMEHFSRFVCLLNFPRVNILK